jgi:hypothetical protein
MRVALGFSVTLCATSYVLCDSLNREGEVEKPISNWKL